MDYSGWACDYEIFWVVENNLVYLRCYSGWAYDSDRFLGY